MKFIGNISRLLAMCAMILALSNVGPQTLAQESDDISLAEETGLDASFLVDVSCWVIGDGSQSTCSFTGSASDGSYIEALWVPQWIACSSIVDASGATSTGDGYHVEGSSLSLTFEGVVSAGGGAGYMVRSGGISVPANGSALVCSDPVFVSDEEAVDTTGNDEPVTDDTVDETPVDPETDSEELPVENETGTDEETVDSDEPTDTSAEEAVDGGDDSGNATGNDGDSSIDPVTEATPGSSGEGNEEETVSGPVGDGSAPTEPVAPAISDDDGETDEVSTAAVEVDITAEVYNCAIDPGASDPFTLDECELADGLDVTATENGSGAETLQTVAGVATFSATVGASLNLTAATPKDYLPLGNGSRTFTVDAATTVVFVNVLEESNGNVQLGRLQLVHGSCPSGEPKDPKFIVIPPRSLRASATESCGPTPFAVLTISGGTLGESIQAVTGENGVWQGFLPSGEYTVGVASGSQSGIPVVADELTAVVVIEYSAAANGSLTITRTVCNVGDVEGTEIFVSDSEIGTSGDGCGPANGQFSLVDLSNQKTIDFSLGNDGSSTQNLPVGTYALTDLTSAKSVNVTIVEGAGTFAAVRTVSLYGTLVVRHYLCDDPDAADQNSSDDSYFETECRQPNGGVAITLYDEGGKPVDTSTGSGGGVVTWQQVEPGVYSVETALGLCATFVDGEDASVGFEVNPGSTTFVKVYTCAGDDGGNSGGDDDDDHGNNGGDDDVGDDDADDDAGGNNGGDDDDGGNNGHVTDDDADDASEVAAVNTLPNTGSPSIRSGTNATEFGLIVLGTLTALLAAAAFARRRMI